MSLCQSVKTWKLYHLFCLYRYKIWTGLPPIMNKKESLVMVPWEAKKSCSISCFFLLGICVLQNAGLYCSFLMLCYTNVHSVSLYHCLQWLLQHYGTDHFWIVFSFHCSTNLFSLTGTTSTLFSTCIWVLLAGKISFVVMLTVPYMSIEWGAQMNHFWWLNIVGSRTVPLVLQRNSLLGIKVRFIKKNWFMN